MNRGNNPTAGDEGPKQHQAVGQDNQYHIPDFQHAPFFLNHHRVQKGCADQPGHKAGVFHRVPAPVAAPAQHVVGPAPAQNQPDGEKQPGHQRPAAGGPNPGGLVGSTRNQGGHGKGIRNDKADKAQVQRGGMANHAGVSQ